jgi:predicted DNA-binding helix-hairpin-helix protein
MAARLYVRQGLRRVYFGRFQPLPGLADGLPEQATPRLRETRLYQADWLVRHYGFAVDELTPADAPDLDPDVDPKLAWALRHPEAFPVDLQRAPREALLRVPGFGRRTVERILLTRAWHRVRVADLLRLRVPVQRALPFIVAADHRPALVVPPPAQVRRRWRQLELFDGERAA